MSKTSFGYRIRFFDEKQAIFMKAMARFYDIMFQKLSDKFNSIFMILRRKSESSTSNYFIGIFWNQSSCDKICLFNIINRKCKNILKFWYEFSQLLLLRHRDIFTNIKRQSVGDSLLLGEG